MLTRCITRLSKVSLKSSNKAYHCTVECVQNDINPSINPIEDIGETI